MSKERGFFPSLPLRQPVLDRVFLGSQPEDRDNMSEFGADDRDRRQRVALRIDVHRGGQRRLVHVR